MPSTHRVPIVAGIVPAFRTEGGGVDIPWAGGVISLNAACLRMFQKMNGKRAVAEIAGAEGWNVPDVLSLINYLATLGVVRFVAPSHPEPRGWIKTTRLVSVSVEIAQRCNQNCKRCYLRGVMPEANEFSLAALDRLFGELVSYGVTSVCLSGGEPLLRSDVLVIVRKARAHRLEVAIATNATLVTPEIARSLRDLGVAMLQISLDGLEPTHDRIRREQGAFRSAERAFRLCHAVGLVAFAITSVNRENVAEILELNRTLGRWGVPGHLVTRYVPSGVADEDFECASGPEFLALLQALREGHETPIYSCDPVINGMLGRTANCGAGYYGASISADGGVKICDTLPWHVGNVRKAEVGEILESSLFIRRLVQRHQNLQTCPILAGDPCYGCVAVQCLASGGPDTQDPYHPSASLEAVAPLKAASTTGAAVPYVVGLRRV